MMRIALIALLVVSSGAAHAERGHERPKRGFSCDDSRTRGFAFYCDPQPGFVEEEVPEIEEKVDPPTSSPAPTKSYTEQIEEYRKALDELKHRAILEPTQENVVAYMQAQQAMVQQAGLFTEVWQRSLFANPSLDANVSRPLSQIGEHLFQDQLDAEREVAFENATSTHALMFVYEGGGTCLVCETQGEVIRALIDQYGVEVLAVSRDGIPLPSFPNSLPDQGQIENLGLADTPSPFLALVEPRSNAVDLIGAGLMTQDVILNRIRIITSIPEGGLYND